MDQKDFFNIRYTTLVDTWGHHNTMQLQWPSIIISTTIIVFSILISAHPANLFETSFWGKDLFIIIGFGIPLILLGTGILSMLYVMGRARQIMNAIENELTDIEGKFGFKGPGFSSINHPKGFSGSKLLKSYLLICLATPLVIIGAFFCVGITLALIIIHTLLIPYLFISIWKHYSKRKK